MFFLTVGEVVGTDEKETVSEIATALLRGVLCVLICAVHLFGSFDKIHIVCILSLS